MNMSKKCLVVTAVAAATAAVAAPLFKFDWLGTTKAAYVVLPGKEIPFAVGGSFSEDGKYFVAVSRQERSMDGFEDLIPEDRNGFSQSSTISLYFWSAQNNSLVKVLNGPKSWPNGSGTFWESGRDIAHLTTFAVGSDGSLQAVAYRFDPSTGRVAQEPLAESERAFKQTADEGLAPEAATPASRLPLELREGQVRVAMKNSSATVQAAWLTLEGATRKGSVFLGADDGRPELAPGQTAVAFSSHGSLWLRKILKLSDSQRSSLYDAARKEAMDRAKQVGLGLIMYAGDSDDFFPLGEGFPNNTIPYVKSQSLFDGFNYNPPGDLKNNNSATTPIGSVNGPDGVATIYADGHVGYTPDP